MLRNTETSWGAISRAFHWVSGVLILGLFAYGLWMTKFPAREDTAYHVAIHASIGISVLALMIARVFWRAVNPTPMPPKGAARWEITASKIGHLGLYVLVFGTLIAGWLLAGSGRAPLDYSLFGIIPMPNMLGTGSPYHKFLEESHELLGYAMIALVAIHIAAAVWHERVRRDGVMDRMTSGRSRDPSATA